MRDAGAGPSGRLRDSDLDVGLTAVALALDHDGLDVVQQPIQECRGQGGVVVEDPGPLLVWTVRRQQRGAALVAVTDDLEQAVGAELVDRQIAQLVDAQDLGLDVGRQRPLEATGGVRGGQCVFQ